MLTKRFNYSNSLIVFIKYVNMENFMSHIVVKKIINNYSTYAGNNWFFDFSELSAEFDEKKVSSYVNKLQEDIKGLTQSWNEAQNTEWLIRHYMALKMLLSASLMLSSAEYAYDKNIKVTDGYLQYYAIFSCMRAILFTDPRTPLNGYEIFKSTHTKTINISTNIISSISKDYGVKIKNYVEELKDIREIFSYGAPSSGYTLCTDITSVNMDNTISTCKLLAEIAQLQSEILEKSIDKHYKGDFSLTEENAEICFEYFINGTSVIDEQDTYRLGYYFRKYPRPTNLLCMVSEGHVEDYFGAWCSNEEDESDDKYNPDDNWRIIFPFP